MTTVRKIELESIFLISMVAAVSFYFTIQRNNQGVFNKSSTRIASVNSPLTTKAPEQNIFSQISPDGAKEVIMKITSNENNAKTYSFYTRDTSSDNEKYIFSKTLDETGNMTVPFNTWSSNNQYFFIEENAVSGKSILAFQASGKPFSDTEKYFDVTEIFKNKETGNNFAEATGWASESLIIINTTKKNGEKGPSYWFEVPSKAVIQLSTEF